MYSRIRISSVTSFPLTEAQKEEFREKSMVKITLTKGHSTMDIHVNKEFTIDIRGHDRPRVLVIVTQRVSVNGKTVVTLERKHGE